ncbi:MAG: nodulation protein NfeD [Bacillaceae bacterium]|nr:nodulation protein NfeD [Bacillaceae bacterium]
MAFLMGLFILMSGFSPNASAEGEVVYVIPVEHAIERGLQNFLQRAFAEAHDSGADAILLEIDTPGGVVDAADKIGNLIRSSEIPVTAFILNDAFSAGTYIALNADQIIMRPGSAMGAATPIDLSGNMASQKMVSAWTKEMMAAADLNDRNPDIARAMVNPDVEIPGLTEKGEVLSLHASEALEHGYAEHIADNRAEALDYMNLQGATVIEVDLTAGEQIARWVTHPYVMPVLLSIGLIGLALELLIPGFGVPGIIGASAFILYFFGHFFAGHATWIHVLLFVVGILLMFIEVFVPGFGIFGGLGIAALVAGIVMSAYDTAQGLVSLGIAFVLTLIFVVVMVKYFGYRGVWNRFILRDEMKTESGYVASEDRRHLVGKEGTALSTLRPAGTAEIDEERLDVVSEGGYIESGKPIRVVKVEGTRIVVREIKS